MAGLLVLLGLLLGALGLWILFQARRGQRETGLPSGRVTYVDTGAWDRCEQPLFSQRYRLTGRPDYLVRGHQGVIPVEVKSGQAPREPYPGHLLQLAAYCLLVEDQEGQPPPYGILKYDSRALELDFTPALRSELLATLQDMRQDREAADVGRTHREKGRCIACGYRQQCEQRLA
jgi:CRISPR-associated exonuclease Cas4